jgi:hypothetical protein
LQNFTTWQQFKALANNLIIKLEESHHDATIWQQAINIHLINSLGLVAHGFITLQYHQMP